MQPYILILLTPGPRPKLKKKDQCNKKRASCSEVQDVTLRSTAAYNLPMCDDMTVRHGEPF